MPALEGLRVLDLTRLLPGAVATMWLANYGAEVIKIEQPGKGDYARHLFMKDEESPVFRATNRGKKSVALDLKSAHSREAFLALMATADVLVENFRPGVMDRLGFGYQDLHAQFPRMIYVAITGYGQTSYWRELAGHDVNYLSIAGVLDLIGVKDGPPVIPGMQLADIAGGSMQAVMGTLLALAERGRTGTGQFVDVSMTHGVASLLALPHAHYRATGVAPQRGDELLSGRFACYNVYPCRDGRWVSVGALESKFWENLCRALDREDLIADQFAGEPRQSEVKAALAELFGERTADEWFDLLGARDCCVTPVRRMDEFEIEDVPRLLPESALSKGDRPPKLGEHTDALLSAAGIDEHQIAELRREGAIQ